MSVVDPNIVDPSIVDPVVVDLTEPPSDAVITEDFVVALIKVSEIAEYQQTSETLRPLKELILQRVFNRIQEKLERRLFGQQPRFENEEKAMGMMRGLAVNLKAASGELLVAAEAMKNRGMVVECNRAYRAHLACAREAAPFLEGK